MVCPAIGDDCTRGNFFLIKTHEIPAKADCNNATDFQSLETYFRWTFRTRQASCVVGSLERHSSLLLCPSRRQLPLDNVCAESSSSSSEVKV